MPAEDSNPRVALTTGLIVIGFVLFVFVYDDLRANPFVQGITGLVLALGIAIVLFSAVPGSFAKVKIPIGLAGAAAFYWLILPRIEPYVFPVRAFSGYILYEKKQSDASTSPVEGAQVEIVGTSSQAKTDGFGKFIIANVPSTLTITNLMVTRAGRIYQINVKNSPEHVYYIPRESQIVQSDKQTVSEETWNEDKGDICPSNRKKEFPSMKQFSLLTNVPTIAGYTDLLLEIRSVNDVLILSARKPEQIDGIRVQTEDESKIQRWEFPVGSSHVRVGVLICLGTAKKGVDISKESLRSTYWFEKGE